ncbi:MAG TPA: hypothetical protein DCX53_07085, partial [Anaerolineae bacterium]|nr:hypothetical protein [Anaerolineae bacterium]
MLDLAQLLRTPHVEPLFDISPDNSKIAFAWNKTGEWQIYELELNYPSQLHPITSGGGGKFNPRYSPDGTKIAYALDSDGSESYHIVVYDPSTNTHSDLTSNTPHALQPNFCWSPVGNQLAFLSDEQGHFGTYIMSVNGEDKNLVLDTSHPAWQVEWSPNGKHLAASCEMQGQDYGIFILDLDTGKTTQVPLNAHEPKWSPDGNRLLFHSDENGWFDIGIYDLSTEGIEWVTKSKNDSQSPVSVGNRIAYLQSKG